MGLVSHLTHNEYPFEVFGLEIEDEEGNRPCQTMIGFMGMPSTPGDSYIDKLEWQSLRNNHGR